MGLWFLSVSFFGFVYGFDVSPCRARVFCLHCCLNERTKLPLLNHSDASGGWRTTQVWPVVSERINLILESEKGET